MINKKGNKKMQTKTNAKRLARLFEKINFGQEPQKLRDEANHLISSLRYRDIKTAEKSLIKDGYPTGLVQQLSDTFMLMVTARIHTMFANIPVQPKNIRIRALKF